MFHTGFCVGAGFIPSGLGVTSASPSFVFPLPAAFSCCVLVSSLCRLADVERSWLGLVVYVLETHVGLCSGLSGCFDLVSSGSEALVLVLLEIPVPTDQVGPQTNRCFP